LAACDYDAELNRLNDWWPTPPHRLAPSEAVEVLFIALEDVPYSFDLRGSASWSRDPDDWEWWFHDDYSGPQFASQIMKFAFERSEVHDEVQPRQNRRGKDAASNSEEVVEMFFSLGYFGLLVRELIRNKETTQMLGNRPSRWFVIGHPDAVYGIILGKLSRSRWQTFHG
jgi:hypothetical protein